MTPFVHALLSCVPPLIAENSIEGNTASMSRLVMTAHARVAARVDSTFRRLLDRLKLRLATK